MSEVKRTPARGRSCGAAVALLASLVGLGSALGGASCAAPPATAPLAAETQPAKARPISACDVLHAVEADGERWLVWKRIFEVSPEQFEEALERLRAVAPSDAVDALTLRVANSYPPFQDSCGACVVGTVEEEEGAELLGPSGREYRDLRLLTAAHPGVTGLVQFSGVGFSDDGNVAVLCVALTSRPRHTRSYALVLRDDRGGWLTVQRIYLGVAG